MYFTPFVAPRAGAWIETYFEGLDAMQMMSRPVRARGLKPLYNGGGFIDAGVAPRAGAWIETKFIFISFCY